MDALLARPGAYIRDPVLWQWQDDKGNWHTYGYNDCRVIEAAHVAGEEEVTLTVNGKSFTLNLASMHEIKEDSGIKFREIELFLFFTSFFSLKIFDNLKITNFFFNNRHGTTNSKKINQSVTNGNGI